MNAWRVQNKLLAETVLSMHKIRKKTKTLRDHLGETANAEPEILALVDRQKKNIALNVEDETTLPTVVG